VSGNPPTLIDKSFLQALSLDEAFWFFQYFDGVLTPVLIAEIIGDLQKTYRDGRNPEKMVSSLARKLCRTPEKHFNVSHIELGSLELLGNNIPMNMRPLVHGLRYDGNDGHWMLTDNSNFLDMLQSWDDGRFSDEELERSRVWRKYGEQFSPSASIDAISSGPTPRPPEIDQLGLSEIRDLQVLSLIGRERAAENLDWAFAELKFRDEYRKAVLQRWEEAGKPALADFAPYCAFMILAIRTHMFASSLEITGVKQKPSDIIDMEYLLYIPFCKFLISDDRFQLNFFRELGEQCQLGVRGKDLKAGLAEIASYFGGSPLSRPLNITVEKLQTPPHGLNNKVTEMWDFAVPGWR